MTSRITTNRPWLFNYYDVIEYDGIKIPNLTARAVMSKLSLDNEALYFTYQIQPNEIRPDIVAARYYQNSRLDFLILLVNQIINPEFEWPLSDSKFDQFISKKYGSFAAASALSHYQLERQSNITVPQYDALTWASKAYWQPNYTSDNRITYYSFKIQDLQLNQAGYEALPIEQQSYWSAISYFTKERDANDKRRNIKLLNKIYVNDALTELRKVFV